MSRSVWTVAVLASTAIFIAGIENVENPTDMNQWIELVAPIMPYLLLIAGAGVVVNWIGKAR